MRLVFLALAAAAVATPSLAADGAKLFALQCKSCHGAKSTLMGPALDGVAGAKIAARTDFKYSAGLKAKSGTWTAANLDAYLAKPAGFAPGTRMTTAVTNADSRKAIVDYLATQK